MSNIFIKKLFNYCHQNLIENKKNLSDEPSIVRVSVEMNRIEKIEIHN